jgi:uncharacterized protein with von Willebrand factor type A (vWA) domain
VPDADALAVGFVGALRAEGVEVPVGATVTFVRALGEVGLHDPSLVYWAGCATLLRTPEQRGPYDRAFQAFWQRSRPTVVAPPVISPIALAVEDGETAALEGGSANGPTMLVRYSRAEVLRHKDLAECTPAELDEAHRLMADVRLAGSMRRARRLRAVNRTGTRGARPDLRRTVRRALRTGGELARPAERAPSERPRRVVLLLDISGSMDPYARALLRFAHAAVVGRRQVEAFTLGTRLTRLTRELSSHDPDAALRRAMGAVEDWSGGTRLGEGLRRFNDQWGTRGLGRGAVVIVLSDGWDRGDPHELARELQRLQRVAHRIVWVNPLKATPGYAPLARGMAAALPFVDEFVEGHSVNALEDLAKLVAS